ncbi:MAG TPA: AmmeMemoRadiSam system protein A [Mariprofundaceae bacterium]|nr:AmmeMemoRadiSam system protein A [Mariprofundaceae bacterium]
MTPERGTLLLRIARASIAESLGLDAPEIDIPEADGWLYEPGACFVTLKKSRQLRGCIGSLEAQRALLEDVKNNARAAALRDPRFPPIIPEEFDRIRIEISLLTTPTPLPPAAEESAAISMLHPGRDGVVLEYGSYRSTFLPQVWQQIPDPHTFLAHLKAKAGLAPGFWHQDLLLSIYRVETYAEEEESPVPMEQATGVIHHG